MDEKRIFWRCHVDEMMWEKSTVEGRKADGQKLRTAGKLSVVKWWKQALPQCLRLCTNLHYRVG